MVQRMLVVPPLRAKNTGRGVDLGAEGGITFRWPLGHSVVLGRVCGCSSGAQGCHLVGDTGLEVKSNQVLVDSKG